MNNMNSIEIKSGYSLLHFDEYPVLFMGFNNNHEVVIGSFLYENDHDTVSYLYSIIPNSLASRFVHKNISYLELLKETETIFIVEKNYNDLITNVQQTNVSEIDPDILPLPTAYCPVVDRSVEERFEDRLGNLKLRKQAVKEDSRLKDISDFLSWTDQYEFPEKVKISMITYVPVHSSSATKRKHQYA
jgi:hypothetical protein